MWTTVICVNNYVETEVEIEQNNEDAALASRDDLVVENEDLEPLGEEAEEFHDDSTYDTEDETTETETETDDGGDGDGETSTPER